LLFCILVFYILSFYILLFYILSFDILSFYILSFYILLFNILSFDILSKIVLNRRKYYTCEKIYQWIRNMFLLLTAGKSTDTKLRFDNLVVVAKCLKMSKIGVENRGLMGCT
jgi:hypothetical protein